MLNLSILRTFLIANTNTFDERYSYLTTCQLQMLITNISFLIFLEGFTLAFNYDVRKKKQTFNEKKQALTMIDEKFIKKNEKHNNANLKLVDQLILKKEIKNIANQN
jgi:hypothetical protein